EQVERFTNRMHGADRVTGHRQQDAIRRGSVLVVIDEKDRCTARGRGCAEVDCHCRIGDARGGTGPSSSSRNVSGTTDSDGLELCTYEQRQAAPLSAASAILGRTS